MKQVYCVYHDKYAYEHQSNDVELCIISNSYGGTVYFSEY